MIDKKFDDPSTAAAPRFEYIDGLRGLASIMVAISHIAHAAADKHPGIFGPRVEQLADIGRYGVQIFFVLSGFVIAHSVATGAYSFGYLGRFAGRRFVRLDLPYWSILALELLLLWVSGMVMVQYMRDLPSMAQILANAIYLQEFLGYEHILPVFWTLCYEVQFYLVFVLSLVLLAKLRESGVSPQTTRKIAIAAFAISFCWSLAIYLGRLPMLHQALFIDRWFQFSFGVITYLYYRQRCSGLWVVAACAACVIGGIAFGINSYRITSTVLTAATALAILASTRVSWWNALLIGPTMQFLGRISYSLYLLHLCVGWRTTVLIRELLASRYNTVWAYVAFGTGIAVSIVAAWIAHAAVEQPAMRLARRIRLPQRAATQPA